MISSYHFNLPENHAVGILRFDLQYRIKHANNTARRLLGLDDSTDPWNDQSYLPEWLILLIEREQKKAAPNAAEIHFETPSKSASNNWFSISLYLTNEVTMVFQHMTYRNEGETDHYAYHKKWILLTEVANHIIFHEEPKHLLDSLFKELYAYLEFDFYFNYILDEKTDKLHLSNYAGVDPETAESVRWLEFGQTVCGCAARDKKIIIIENVQQSVDPRVKLIQSLGIQSYVCHPLLSYGKLIGTLSFGSSTRSFFNQTELELLNTICKQTAMALERAFLITELRNKNNELTNNYQMLCEKEKQLRDVFNGALDGIMLLDRDYRIVDVNPVACQMLDISCWEDTINEFLFDYIEITNLRSDIGEVSVLLPSGKEIIFEYTIKWDVMPGITLVIFRDVTSKHRTALALKQAKEKAELANKSMFFSMMSHELRTPLNSILGYSQIMLDDQQNPLSEIQANRTKKILTASMHLLDLINDLLDHSQLELGKLNFNFETVDLRFIAGESIRLLQPLAEKKQLLIENLLPSDRGIFVLGDAVKIKQIMTNLLANAIKYNVYNGRIKIRQDHDDAHVTIYVEDTGIGMSEDQLSSIFEPFYRIYHPEHNIDGAGIGLSIVKNYLILMNGNVGVSSQENKGSCFWFKLPLSQETNE